MNYYAQSCPRAEEIVKEQVIKLYHKHGNTAVSWVRYLFHDCMVKSCDASLLLETANGIVSEMSAERSFGMRNFKYITTIKAALESECPVTVSCADIIALSAREGVKMLGGSDFSMKTGRRDSQESNFALINSFIPNHNDTMSLVLSQFQSIGVDAEGTVALLGAHSVGRVHCKNLVHRLYPEVDPTLDPAHAEYLKGRCPTPDPDPNAVLYARNDLETPMTIDNMYYKNILNHKGLLLVDQQLVSDPITSPFVEKMASDNGYFYDQFSKALVIMSENNPLTGEQGFSELQVNYYAQSCPRAEEIVKERVIALYNEHGNTAVSWVRNLFHDCMVQSCDASLLLETTNGIVSETSADRNFGMRNFKYVDTIKTALESECPKKVSCADIVALSSREGVKMVTLAALSFFRLFLVPNTKIYELCLQLGGPQFSMKTGRRDSRQSHAALVNNMIPNHNDSVSFVLSRFQSIGVDVEGAVALLDPTHAEYLKGRCPTSNPDPNAVLYARIDLETPMTIDNMYYKNILKHKALLSIDQQLLSNPITAPFVKKMAADNAYFYNQFSKALVIMSENNPLTGDQGEIRKDCRYVN
ncbi:hypothetical protein GIB67_030261 [Kingdonia uniflora]|uniref:peroxidase n=1 Tax=Kingdonia uniflora TaxID=39325 RepID=A0A7J7M6M2_9MAGN|nr:hypothetical protein GIB67_030261 [Kingdonia uniflora]